MEICLIRHGETVYNIEDRMQGVREIELSPKGIDEAKALGTLLKRENILPGKIFSSPVKRAIDTARYMNLEVEVVPNSAFRARSLGDLEGLTKTEIRSRFPGALKNLLLWDWLPPGGDETLRDMFRRANTEIESLWKSEESFQMLGIVTHSGVLEALIRGWLSLSPEDSLPFLLKNAGGAVFFKSKTGWEVKKDFATGDRSFEDFS